ncbi:MAG TPA: hypothetical protein VD999_07845 [Vitreimonas sp.]|nr:hypothetical protein [Vitreimonas sp.]
MAQALSMLYAGYDQAYGTFKITGSRDRDNKQKGIAKVIKAEVNLQLWINHIMGEASLGIVPIRVDNTCVFGAIDIDVYPINIGEVMQKVSEQNFPLVPTTTKSGGLHLWLFTTEPVSAEVMQRKLREMAAVLGFGGSEIFPKQTEVLTDRGDVGSWINMPYFDHEKTTRHGVYIDGAVQTLEEYIEFANENKVTPDQLDRLVTHQDAPKSDLHQGPPCLQLLASQGFPAGTRNIGLYNLGVYAKKSNPDMWEKIIEQFNVKYMDPPLGSSEIKELVKSLKKKDYQYQCKVQPLYGHCNSVTCRSRKYGVGNHQGMPIITSLTKYNTQPPVWFVDVEGGGRVELATEDLQMQSRFQKRCMDALNAMPPVMKQDVWQGMIQALLENVEVIDAPRDASPRGLLIEYLERFCTQRAQAKMKEEVILGKPFTEGGFHYIRMSDFLAYLERNKFREFKQTQIANILKNDLGANHSFFNVKGKGVNCWAIPEFASGSLDLDVPSEIKPPPY